MQRIRAEALEEQKDTRGAESAEPLFGLVLGLPGAGKSEMFKWVRELFEVELGWTHGVHFVCLAYQNAMAALINGNTMHHWSGMPINESEGTTTTRDKSALSTRCQ